MKKLVFILSLAMALPVMASEEINFNCQTQPGYESLGSKLEVQVAGKLVPHPTSYQLDYFGRYEIDCNESKQNCWTRNKGEEGRTSNVSNYKPRKYKDHMKFNLDLSNNDSFGDFDFIFPNRKLFTGKKKFNAYLIMSWVDDHFGTTVTLNCEMTEEYVVPKPVDIQKPFKENMHACEKWVHKRNDVMNICGGTIQEVYCSQMTEGANVVCSAEAGWPSSECSLKITLDKDCYRNKSVEITSDGREDM